MASALHALMAAAAATAAEGPLDAGRKILEHVGDGERWMPGVWWSPTKTVLFMSLAAVFVVVAVVRAARGYDADGAPRTRLAQMLDPFAEHFHRQVALPFAGQRWAGKVTPLLLSFFFFILTCNLMGLAPLSDVLGLILSPFGRDGVLYRAVVEGGSTPTGNFNVTLGLAVVAFFAIIGFGVAQHGLVGHFSHLAPKSAPFLVRWLLLLPIETLSMFVKPFALTMRLAANMLAGHMGLLALLMLPLILRDQGIASAICLGAGLPVVALAIGIMLLEIIVAFVQAYVFALLSGVFIGMAIHSH